MFTDAYCITSIASCFSCAIAATSAPCAGVFSSSHFAILKTHVVEGLRSSDVLSSVERFGLPNKTIDLLGAFAKNTSRCNAFAIERRPVALSART